MKNNSKNNNLIRRKANLAARTTSHPQDKAEDENSFKILSYRLASNATRTHMNTETGKAPQAKGKDFNIFQKDIYPIIVAIVKDTQNQDHAAICHLRQVQWGRTTISSATTFCTISKLLDFTNIREYKQYIATFPNIDNYITFA
jgi:hypothetical protein